jgi:hypothetical protein
LILDNILGRYAKNWIVHQNNILHYYFSKSVHGYLTQKVTKKEAQFKVLKCAKMAQKSLVIKIVQRTNAYKCSNKYI